MRNLVIAAVGVALSSLSFGASLKTAPPPKQVTPPPAAQFEIEKGLLNSIYKESISETFVEPGRATAGITVTPQLSFVNVQKASLSNGYFDVFYGETLKGVPAISLSLSTPIAYMGGFMLSGIARIGYSYKEALTSVRSKSGLALKDVIKLHWLPLSLGTKAEFQIKGVSQIRPYLDLGVGAQWLNQSGKLDGLEQGFWIPFYKVGGGLSLFGSNGGSNDWFGGISVGVSLHNSFASDQILKNWSLDTGVSLIL